MNNIRVGIVGTGFMAVVHLRAYEAVNGIEIGALCNPSGRNLDGDFSDVHGNVGSAVGGHGGDADERVWGRV